MFSDQPVLESDRRTFFSIHRSYFGVRICDDIDCDKRLTVCFNELDIKVFMLPKYHSVLVDDDCSYKIDQFKLIRNPTNRYSIVMFVRGHDLMLAFRSSSNQFYAATSSSELFEFEFLKIRSTIDLQNMYEMLHNSPVIGLLATIEEENDDLNDGIDDDFVDNYFRSFDNNIEAERASTHSVASVATQPIENPQEEQENALAVVAMRRYIYHRHHFSMFIRRAFLFEDFTHEVLHLLKAVHIFTEEKCSSKPFFITSVTMENEIGVDAGGIITDVLSQVGKFLNRFIIPVECDLKVLNTRVPFTCDQYKVFGVYLGLLYINQIPLSGTTQYSFFARLIDLPHDALLEERECYSSLLKIESDYTVDDDDEDEESFLFTIENKKEMFETFLKKKFITYGEYQWECVRKGFWMIVHQEEVDQEILYRSLNPLTFVSLDLWIQNTEYSDYNSQSRVIKWFWKYFAEFPERKDKLLRFTTGKNFINQSGFLSRFTIQRTGIIEGTIPFPIAHTCAFQIDLPDYPTEEMFVSRMNYTLDVFEETGFHII